MEEQNFEPSHLVPQKTMNPLVGLWSLIIGMLLLVFLIAGIIAANKTFVSGAAVMVQILTWIVVILVPSAIIAGIVVLVQNHRRKARIADLEIQRAEQEIAYQEKLHLAQISQISTQTQVLARTINFDDQGNAAVVDGLGRIVQLAGQMREHPNLSSLHYSNKIDGAKADQLLLPEANQDIPKPTIEEIVSFVKRNAYEFVIGRSLQSRELIKIELPDAHIKLIGGSRMGKSCEAAAIIDQAMQTHDREHLLVAMLDLEYKTSRLFESDPHILTVNTGYKKVRMHAKDIAQVAEHLVILHDVMQDRYTLTDAQVSKLPRILIYLEEFLYWKKLLKQSVSADLRERALASFMGIATRGLKVGLHLMCCAQVDYADEDLKEAMAQFLAVNLSFSVRPSAAQAAGFVQTELLNQNFRARQRGQFVVEAISGSDIGIAPDYDVRAKLEQLTGIVESDEPRETRYENHVSEVPQTLISERVETQRKPNGNMVRNQIDPALQAKVRLVMEVPGESMVETMKRVWNVSPGRSAAYEQAKQEYIQVQEMIHSMARKAMEVE